ncbi:AraC family transcriptional regulator [Chryseobacterium lathyri]|uniref:AraC family transcriptional regulator n=1 Tax=Chryseobacterium lathyri TaxID=395933 RepID=UPI00277E6DB4|nr:AraC family transcriptional regulator [Chryseobacterium lathyri]MDQ0065230.1 AraC-like DNA-binding protein [Chryseobacterium lathyri]
MSKSFQNLKFEFLDNIELFSSEDETEYFPFHVHDYFCISLICKGTELLQTPDGDHYATSGLVSITQADEVHKNSSVDTSPYSYKTFYVNPDVLKYYNNGKNIQRLQRVIDDRALYTGFNYLSLGGENRLQDFQKALKRLTAYSEKEEEKQAIPSFSFIDELAGTIPYVPINLEDLSKKFFMSKFHFAREFKKAKGISPMSYIMIKRLNNSKRMLLQGEDIQTVCYLMGFYDAAHLNTAFKRFFGITLRMIKNSNIIQDISVKGK